MAFVSNVKFEEPTRNTFVIKDFSGGICNTKSPTKLADNQCLDMLNIEFGLDGVLKKRSGLVDTKLIDVKLVEAELYGDTIQSAFIVEPSTNTYGFILHAKTAFIYVTSKGLVKRMEWETIKDYVPVRGIQYLDKFYFVDGGRRVHFYKLADLEDSEIAQPIRYYISNPPSSFTPAPKPAVTGVVKESEVYAWNDKNPSSLVNYPCKDIWYEPCQQEMEDGYKGENYVINYPRLITVYKDRLIISGNIKDPNMIYISDVNNPLYFPVALPVQAPPTGDLITALIPFMDSLVVGRRDSMYCLYGNTNRTDAGSPFTLKRLSTHTGIPNSFCSNQINNYLFYIGSDGHAYKMSTTQTDVNQLITTIANKNFDFTLPPFNATKQMLTNAHTGFDPVKQEWYVQADGKTAVYNYSLMAWTRYNNILSRRFITIDNTFYIVQENGAFCVFDDNIYYDNVMQEMIPKVPIHAYWRSKEIDFGVPTRIKQIRNTFLVSESYDNAFSDVSVRYSVDSVEVIKKYNIQNEIPLWDVAKWDRYKFYSENLVRSLPIMVGRRGRSFNITVSSPYFYKGFYVEDIPSFKEIIDMKIGQIFVVRKYEESYNPSSNHVDYYYLRTDYELSTGSAFKLIAVGDEEFEAFLQPMKIYELSGIYELRGYR